ncbi:MAG: glycosyltransferase involved in cell wall biosynthesis [Paraglaciecola sp.]|jgi:glycosyltransferase involved in cell wall biosynthesis
MNTIKVLIDARVIGGEAQGSSTYLKGIYNNIHKHFGNVYDLFFAGYDFDSIKEAFPFLEKKRFIQLKSISKIGLLGFEFPKIIKQYNIDFSHFQYATPFVKNCKFIITTHDVLFNDFKDDFSKWYAFKRNFLFKLSLEKSEIRLTVSGYSRKRIANHYNLPQSSLHITPNGVRPEFFEAFDSKAVKMRIKQKFGAERYLLYVSRIEPRKNHKMVMDAFRELNLAEQGYQLVFIGNDTLKSKKEVAEINQMQACFPNHFHWFSNISDEDLINFYRGTELFVYPSKAEGFGIPPIEAVASGARTLCSNMTAMEDFNFFEGNYFSPDNLEELKMKISQIIDHPRRAWSTYVLKKIVEERYSWNVSSNLLHDLIQKETQPINVNAPQLTKEHGINKLRFMRERLFIVFALKLRFILDLLSFNKYLSENI